MRPILVATATTGRDTLQRTLESLYEQTFNDFDHLLIMDGPGELKVKDSYLMHTPWQTGNAGGYCYGMASLLAARKYKYIAFLDDDNWWNPDHLQSLLDLAQEFPYDSLNYFHSSRLIWTTHNNALKPVVYDDPKSPHIDTSSLFLPSWIAASVANQWSRHRYETDRVVRMALDSLNATPHSTEFPSLNYRGELEKINKKFRLALDNGVDTVSKYLNSEPKELINETK